MTEPQHISDLERRRQALNDEIAKALLHCAADDPMIIDLKLRCLFLGDEIDQLRHDAA